MSDFLQLMKRGSEERLQKARGRVSERELRVRIAELPAAPGLVLHAGGFDVIAELKLVSPAAGRLKDQAENVTARVSAYARGGAAAVSVLTEPSRFGGSLDHLQEAAVALHESGVPVMRKDFLVSPYQVLEARAHGAGGVLVILAMLDDASCLAIINTALEQGMFVLLEAFDRGELARAGHLLTTLPQTGGLELSRPAQPAGGSATIRQGRHLVSGRLPAGGGKRHRLSGNGRLGQGIGL